MTLYLTDGDRRPRRSTASRESGFVAGVKCYPAGATTHSDAGVTSLARCEAAIARMEERDVVLQLHGEATGDDVDPYDRESVFIERRTRSARQARHPRLRVVLEHVTTRAGVEFVRVDRRARRRDDHAAAPALQSRRDVPRRAAAASLLPAGPEAGARSRGTCSRPRPAATRASSLAPTAHRTRAARRNHPAAAPAFSRRRPPSSSTRSAFEQAGRLDRLEAFASFHGADFYGLPRNTRFGHARATSRGRSRQRLPFGAGEVVPMCAGETLDWKLRDPAPAT